MFNVFLERKFFIFWCIALCDLYSYKATLINGVSIPASNNIRFLFFKTTGHKPECECKSVCVCGGNGSGDILLHSPIQCGESLEPLIATLFSFFPVSHNLFVFFSVISICQHIYQHFFTFKDEIMNKSASPYISDGSWLVWYPANESTHPWELKCIFLLNFGVISQ